MLAHEYDQTPDDLKFLAVCNVHHSTVTRYQLITCYLLFGVLFSDHSTLKLIIRAEVKKGYSPVIGAKVEVQVGTLPWKLMKDDGLGRDLSPQHLICIIVNQ